MLSRLIARLLFKAVLSLAMLLGVASYGLYLTGGDPKAVWRRVASGTIGSVGESVGGIGERVSRALDTSRGHESPVGQVWTWRDGNGLVHYASTPPAGVAATALSVDPDVNVLAPVRTRAPHGPYEVSGGDQALMHASGQPRTGATLGGSAGPQGGGRGPAGRGEGGLDEPLPGIAGAIARARGDAPAPDPAKAEALLRMLQMPSR